MLGLNDEQVGECEAMLRAAAASDELAGSAEARAVRVPTRP